MTDGGPNGVRLIRSLQDDAKNREDPGQDGVGDGIPVVVGAARAAEGETSVVRDLSGGICNDASYGTVIGVALDVCLIRQEVDGALGEVGGWHDVSFECDGRLAASSTFEYFRSWATAQKEHVNGRAMTLPPLGTKTVQLTTKEGMTIWAYRRKRPTENNGDRDELVGVRYDGRR